jgi:hypothetical protein
MTEHRVTLAFQKDLKPHELEKMAQARKELTEALNCSRELFGMEATIAALFDLVLETAIKVPGSKSALIALMEEEKVKY